MVEPYKSLEEGIRTCNVVALNVWSSFEYAIVYYSTGYLLKIFIWFDND
jgi:hypothetical protein